MHAVDCEMEGKIVEFQKLRSAPIAQIVSDDACGSERRLPQLLFRPQFPCRNPCLNPSSSTLDPQYSQDSRSFFHTTVPFRPVPRHARGVNGSLSRRAVGLVHRRMRISRDSAGSFLCWLRDIPRKGVLRHSKRQWNRRQRER